MYCSSTGGELLKVQGGEACFVAQRLPRVLSWAEHLHLADVCVTAVLMVGNDGQLEHVHLDLFAAERGAWRYTSKQQ